MVDRAELAAWLRLLGTPGIGRAKARELLARFGSPEAAIGAPPAELRASLGEAGAALRAPSAELEARIDATFAWLAAASATPRAIVALGEPAYPARLLETADPPLLLYAEGRLDCLALESVAVVGSRNPTRQGVDNARALASALGSAGLAIVSGMAVGIDAAAHEGALASGAATVAVVGTGLDVVYPRRHATLAERIRSAGVIVSEFPLGTPPLSPNFPVRNRIIAGLSRGTLVVEAALRSGSLITARMAIEAGREVFAVPGSIHSLQSRGCHALIKQGAKLVETAQDVFEELGGYGSAASGSAATGRTDTSADGASDAAVRPEPILEALGYDPMTLDALVDRTGWPAAELNVRLLELELEGRVARLPGQLFQRIARG